jgi:hypothetical protein
MNGKLQVEAGLLAHNTQIDAMEDKKLKGTAIGLWYVQVPNIFVIDPFGNVVEPKVYKGNRVIIEGRKQVSVSKLPHLNYSETMNFKKIFCDAS